MHRKMVALLNQGKKQQLGQAYVHKNGPTVQCWLCNGPHLFQQCKELIRMNSVCAQWPWVKKHFWQLLRERNAPVLKFLADAPDFFDDEPSSPHENDQYEESSHDNQEEDAQVKSVSVIPNDTFTIFNDGATFHNVTTFPIDETNHQISQHMKIKTVIIKTSTFYPLKRMMHYSDIHEVQMLSTSQQCFSLSSLPGFIISESSSLYIPIDEGSPSICSASIQQNDSQVKYHQFTAQEVDGSADQCTTPHHTLVANMRPPNPFLGEPLLVLDAGKQMSTKLRESGAFAKKSVGKW